MTRFSLSNWRYRSVFKVSIQHTQLRKPLTCSQAHCKLIASNCAPLHPLQMIRPLTSQMPALLQMVDALPVVALPQLLAHQSPHHDLDPLLPDNGILGLLEARGVFVVDSVKGGRDRGLLGQEGRRLGGGHRDVWTAGVVWWRWRWHSGCALFFAPGVGSRGRRCRRRWEVAARVRSPPTSSSMHQTNCCPPELQSVAALGLRQRTGSSSPLATSTEAAGTVPNGLGPTPLSFHRPAAAPLKKISARR